MTSSRTSRAYSQWHGRERVCEAPRGEGHVGVQQERQCKKLSSCKPNMCCMMGRGHAGPCAAGSCPCSDMALTRRAHGARPGVACTDFGMWKLPSMRHAAPMLMRSCPRPPMACHARPCCRSWPAVRFKNQPRSTQAAMLRCQPDEQPHSGHSPCHTIAAPRIVKSCS